MSVDGCGFYLGTLRKLRTLAIMTRLRPLSQRMKDMGPLLSALLRVRTIALLLLLTVVAFRSSPRFLQAIDSPSDGVLFVDEFRTMGINSPFTNSEASSKTAATTIHLLGERHSGTKWMTAHLNECFGLHENIRVVSALSRWKHWFRESNGASVSRVCSRRRCRGILAVLTVVSDAFRRGRWSLRHSKRRGGGSVSACEPMGRGYEGQCE